MGQMGPIKHIYVIPEPVEAPKLEPKRIPMPEIKVPQREPARVGQ